MSLKLSNISKKFGEDWVLRDVSLEVSEGEIFGVLGENGSGKSRLLHLIAGGVKPDSGRISFRAQDLTTLSERERDFAFPQQESPGAWTNFFKKNKVETASSGGEEQKRIVEDALEKAAGVLLLDNPFCCAIESVRDEALANLRRTVRDKKLSVVYVTNDHEEAFSVCDTIGVLHRGEIVQTGTPRQLYEKPANAAVAKVLGRNNFIKARRVSFNNEPTQEFQTLDGEHRLQIGKIERRALGTITDAVTLAIRPEHISISFGASFPEDNLLKAQIAEVQYQGATTRIKLNANGLSLEALVLRLVGLNVGDECMVGMPPDRILVLKD